MLVRNPARLNVDDEDSVRVHVDALVRDHYFSVLTLLVQLNHLQVRVSNLQFVFPLYHVLNCTLSVLHVFIELKQEISQFAFVFVCKHIELIIISK